MWVMNSFTYKDVSKILKTIWCFKKYDCKWSHEIWFNPHTLREFTVVNHCMRETTLMTMLEKSWISQWK